MGRVGLGRAIERALGPAYPIYKRLVDWRDSLAKFRFAERVRLPGTLFEYAGTSARLRPTTPKQRSKFSFPQGCPHVDDFPEWEKLDYPRRDPETCINTLIVNSNKYAAVNPLPVCESEDAFLRECFEREFPVEPLPEFCQQRRLPERGDVVKYMATLNPDANPGAPYAVSQQKKFEFVVSNVDNVAALAQLRLFLVSVIDPVELRHTDPVGLVRSGLVDPYYVIEKNELYEYERKPARIIISCSVVDELVDKALFKPGDSFRQQHYGEHSYMVGLGMDDVNASVVVESYAACVRESAALDPTVSSLRSIDVSTNDFSITEAQLERVANRRADIASGDSTVFRRACVNRALCTSRGLMVFADGTLLCQTVYGYQKSGKGDTTSTNTLCSREDNLRVQYLHGIENARRAFPSLAAGDDSLVVDLPDLVTKYRAIGKIIKDDASTNDGDSFDFCSHRYARGQRPLPKRDAKAFLKLLSDGPDLSKYVAVLSYFRRTPRYAKFVAIVERLGWPGVN